MKPSSSPADAGVVQLALLGHPVAHSRSPALHQAFARALGHRVDYTRIDCPPDHFAAQLAALAASGARGCNVTLPHKADALAACPQRSARASLAQAANTIRFDAVDAGGWLADNTDGVGLVADLLGCEPVAIAGRALVLVGAGGAAAGCLGPLIAQRPARIDVLNRSPERAQALVARHAALAAAHGCTLSAAALADAAGCAQACGGWDGAVNASSASLHGVLPLPTGVLRPGGWAVDLMYGAAAEPFLAWARAQGAQARDGLGMLVEQAAEAYALWLGQRPPTAGLREALRQQMADEAPDAAHHSAQNIAHNTARATDPTAAFNLETAVDRFQTDANPHER